MSKLRITIFLLCSQLVFACGGSESPVAPPSQLADAAEVTVYDKDADIAEPAVAAAPDGGLYVLYIEHHADKSSDVYLQRVDSSLKLDGERVRVNKIGGEVKTWAGDPPTIGAAADGTVYVGWTRKVTSTSGSGTDLMVSVSHDGGLTFDDPVKVNDDSLPASHGMHSLALGQNGEVYAAWLDERALRSGADGGTHHQAPKSEDSAEPNSEVYFAVSKDGGKSFSQNRRIAGDVCPCCKTSMAVAADGTLYLSWRQVLPESFRHIAVAASDDRGESFKQSVIVSDDKWQINACPVSGASMTAGAGGKLEVIWYSAGSAGAPGLYRAESKNNGQSFEARSLISTDAISGTPVLLSEENSSAIYVFGASDKRVTFAAADQSALGDVDNGVLPAAALSKGKLIAAFVRSGDENRSVRLIERDLRNLAKH